MRSLAVIFAVIGMSAVAHAQSRADQVPPSHSDASIPVAPTPSDDTTDQPEQPRPEPDVVSPPPEPPSKLVLARAADDTLSGHLLLRLITSYSHSFGSLDSATSLSTGGLDVKIGAGYGLSRSVEAQLFGALAEFRAPSECTACSARSYSLVAGLNYHLVQGVRLDPWVRVGVGVSAYSLRGMQGDRSYLGLQWLNAAIGGDWYANRNFGFGPMFSIALTSYFDHPSGSNSAIAGELLAGLSFVFDSTGK